MKWMVQSRMQLTISTEKQAGMLVIWEEFEVFILSESYPVSKRQLIGVQYHFIFKARVRVMYGEPEIQDSEQTRQPP